MVDTNHLCWTSIAADEGKTPGNRTYFSLVTANDKLALFGGFGDSGGRFNDLFSFDTATLKWESVEQKGSIKPKPVYLHSAVMYQNRMYCFGGSTGEDINKLYSFNFDTSEWKLEEQSGDIPSPRHGHAAVVCDGFMIVVGGCHHQDKYTNDTFSFDFAKKLWKKLGDVSMTMAYHSLVVHNHKCYLYGGYNGSSFGQGLHMLDMGSGTWSKVQLRGKAPPDRCGCAAEVFDNHIYIFGGYTADGHTNTLHRIAMDSMTWETVELGTDSRPVPRAYLKTAKVASRMYLYGGYNGKRCISDFQVIQVVPDPVNMAKTMAEMSLEDQTVYALRHFGNSSATHIDREGVKRMLTNIWHFASSLTQQEPSLPTPSPDFDIQVVQDGVGMGFTHEHVIFALTKMKAQGIGISQHNFSTLLDQLVNEPYTNEDQAMAKKLAAEREAAKAQEEKLHDRLNQKDLELQERSLCKICFHNKMDTAVDPCGHIAACHQCMSHENTRECVVCRTPITRLLKVFLD